jgi:hypothetical protein
MVALDASISAWHSRLLFSTMCIEQAQTTYLRKSIENDPIAGPKLFGNQGPQRPRHVSTDSSGHGPRKSYTQKKKIRLTTRGQVNKIQVHFEKQSLKDICDEA